MEPDKIGVKDAAKILGVSGPMVNHLITYERIRPLGKFGGAWILDRAQIEALKRERDRIYR
jgi:Helix-turn-helix domain